MSRLRLPVGIDSTNILVASPSRMTIPSPYFLFRLPSVVSNARTLPLSTVDGASTLAFAVSGLAFVLAAHMVCFLLGWSNVLVDWRLLT
jgi:hypothetical protein